MSQGFANKLPLPLPVTMGGTGATDGASAFNNLGGIPSQNLIIGGNFNTNPWQRGTSFPAPADNTYVADRFCFRKFGSGAVTVSRALDSPSPSVLDYYSQFCLKIQPTTTSATIPANNFYSLQYNMEGNDFARISQRPFTTSIWVKATKPGIYSYAIRNTAQSWSFVAEYTINASNTWEKKVIVVPASPATGSWIYAANKTITIDFSIAAASNMTTSTLGVWQAGNFLASTNQVNGMDSTANSFNLQLFKIEPGTVSTPYVVEFATDVLQRCQRYYNKSYAQGTNPGAVTSAGCESYVTSSTGYTSGTLLNSNRFPVTMRATPTVTIYSTNSSTTGVIYNSTATGELAAVASNVNDRSYGLQINNTMNTNNVFTWHYIASAEL